MDIRFEIMKKTSITDAIYSNSIPEVISGFMDRHILLYSSEPCHRVVVGT